MPDFGLRKLSKFPEQARKNVKLRLSGVDVTRKATPECVNRRGQAYARFHHRFRFPDAVSAGLRSGRGTGCLRDTAAKFAVHADAAQSQQFSVIAAGGRLAQPADSVFSFFGAEHAVDAFTVHSRRDALDAISFNVWRDAFDTRWNAFHSGGHALDTRWDALHAGGYALHARRSAIHSGRDAFLTRRGLAGARSSRTADIVQSAWTAGNAVHIRSRRRGQSRWRHAFAGSRRITARD